VVCVDEDPLGDRGSVGNTTSAQQGGDPER
jgi:hypothetical protein